MSQLQFLPVFFIWKFWWLQNWSILFLCYWQNRLLISWMFHRCSLNIRNQTGIESPFFVLYWTYQQYMFIWERLVLYRFLYFAYLRFHQGNRASSASGNCHSDGKSMLWQNQENGGVSATKWSQTQLCEIADYNAIAWCEVIYSHRCIQFLLQFCIVKFFCKTRQPYHGNGCTDRDVLEVGLLNV